MVTKKTLLLAMATLLIVQSVSAEDGAPDHEVVSDEPISVGVPAELAVPRICDPVELIFCFGPFQRELPASAAVYIDDLYGATWLHAGEMQDYGPNNREISLPDGTTIPYTICPSTCSIPAYPALILDFNVGLCYNAGEGEICNEQYVGFLYTPNSDCPSDRTSRVSYACRLDDGRLQMSLPDGTTITWAPDDL